MTRTHWITLALFLAGLSSMVGALHDWAEMLTPQFLGGVMGIGASVINASFGDKPAETNMASRAAATVVNKLSGTGE